MMHDTRLVNLVRQKSVQLYNTITRIAEEENMSVTEFVSSTLLDRVTNWEKERNEYHIDMDKRIKEAKEKEFIELKQISLEACEQSSEARMPTDEKIRQNIEETQIWIRSM